jgi:hypothetical protein
LAAGVNVAIVRQQSSMKAVYRRDYEKVAGDDKEYEEG